MQQHYLLLAATSLAFTACRKETASVTPVNALQFQLKFDAQQARSNNWERE